MGVKKSRVGGLRHDEFAPPGETSIDLDAPGCILPLEMVALGVRETEAEELVQWEVLLVVDGAPSWVRWVGPETAGLRRTIVSAARSVGVPAPDEASVRRVP